MRFSTSLDSLRGLNKKVCILFREITVDDLVKQNKYGRVIVYVAYYLWISRR